jgi:threonine dehydratase
MTAPAAEPAAARAAPPSLAEARAAADRIRGRVRRTPLERSDYLSARLGSEVRLKLECWQRTRSFKVRGAFNALASLTPAARGPGVVTASAGNHGQAVALAAREYGVPATIFVPSTAPRIKRERIAQLGATLSMEAADYDQAEELAQAYAARAGLAFVHAYSAAAVVAGQATLGLEVAEDAPDTVDIVVPVGGGGLIAGVGAVARALLPHARVIGVQSVETRAMYEAFGAGRVVPVDITPTLADGLAGCTDTAAWERAHAVVDDLVLVEEADIAAAIRMLHARDGVVAEGAAAVAVAAVLSGRVRLRGPAVLIVTGGNIDGYTLADILTRAES